jgi:hypothetical protein
VRGFEASGDNVDGNGMVLLGVEEFQEKLKRVVARYIRSVGSEKPQVFTPTWATGA